MIVLMNSSKTLEFEQTARISEHTIPEFLNDCEVLVAQLRKLSVAQLAKLMGVSVKLAQLNVARYRNWQTPFTVSNAKQALLAFKGDIYSGIQVDRYTKQQLDFAQTHVRILSGLYGILRPLDLIQPYRLEMATKLATESGQNLYQFWGTRINASLKALLKRQKSGILINLASVEYFKVVEYDLPEVKVVTPVFKEYKNQSHRVVTIYAKKARGLMCDYIIQNRLTRIEDLKSFNLAGYRFNPKLSATKQLVFTRGDEASLGTQ